MKKNIVITVLVSSLVVLAITYKAGHARGYKAGQTRGYQSAFRSFAETRTAPEIVTREADRN